MKAWMAGVALAGLWTATAAAQEPASLTLNCVGTDDVVIAMTPYAWSGRSYAGGVGYGEGGTGAALAVAVEGGKVRVRPPKTSVPMFAKGSRDGWYDLTDVTVDRLTIRGRLKWNRLDRVTLEVDRRTGQATFGAFLGTCQRVSNNPDSTKF